MVLKGQIDTPRMNHKIVVKGFDIRKLNKEIPALLPACCTILNKWVDLSWSPHLYDEHLQTYFAEWL